LPQRRGPLRPQGERDVAERNLQPYPKLVYFTEVAELRSGGTSSKEKAGRHIIE